MFKNFKKKENNKKYKIAFCDKNDLSTKFGEWKGEFETYQKADFVIRMNWNKEKKEKENNGYKINGAWLVIEEI